MKAAAVRRVQRAWQFAFQRRGKIAPALARVDKARVATTAKLAALQAAVETIADKTDGLNGTEIAAAIDKAVTTALADLEVTLTTKEGE